MTNNIEKQNAGRGGAVIVTNGTPPVGEYCEVEFITATIITTPLNTPLLSGSQTGITFPAGTSIKTLIIGGEGVIGGPAGPTGPVGAAIFYKAI